MKKIERPSRRYQQRSNTQWREAFKRNVLFQRMRRIPTRPQRLGEGYEFVITHSDDLIERLGDYNPVYGRKLKKSVADLVMAASGGVRKPDIPLLHFGLMYRYPPIPMKRATVLYPSWSSFALMDHWAERFPGFRRFHACFIDKKTKAKVREDWGLLVHDILPDEIAERLKAERAGIEAREFMDLIENNRIQHFNGPEGGYYHCNGRVMPWKTLAYYGYYIPSELLDRGTSSGLAESYPWATTTTTTLSTSSTSSTGTT